MERKGKEEPIKSWSPSIINPLRYTTVHKFDLLYIAFSINNFESNQSISIVAYLLIPTKLGVLKLLFIFSRGFAFSFDCSQHQNQFKSEGKKGSPTFYALSLSIIFKQLSTSLLLYKNTYHVPLLYCSLHHPCIIECLFCPSSIQGK
jgi:hypothetical protein